MTVGPEDNEVLIFCDLVSLLLLGVPVRSVAA